MFALFCRDIRTCYHHWLPLSCLEIVVMTDEGWIAVWARHDQYLA
jgi:hypothetical protein